MSEERPPKLVHITVSGGSGQGVVTMPGNVLAISIIAPADTTFDIELYDDSGFPIMGDTITRAISRLQVDIELHYHTNIFITNAIVDGLYKVKFVYV